MLVAGNHDSNLNDIVNYMYAWLCNIKTVNVVTDTDSVLARTHCEQGHIGRERKLIKCLSLSK